jgi:hypothetical protein
MRALGFDADACSKEPEETSACLIEMVVGMMRLL